LLTVKRVRQALRAHDGNVHAAARALGVQRDKLRAAVDRLGLGGDAAALRTGARQRKVHTFLAFMARHRGSVASAARELGVRPSTVGNRIDRWNLGAAVKAMRPRRPTPAEERARILEAIRRNSGQIWKVERELGIPASTLKLRLRKYNLFAEADALRVEANLIGPRTRLPRGRDPERRRLRLAALLSQANWTIARASQASPSARCTTCCTTSGSTGWLVARSSDSINSSMR
jgi:transcriptional regulator with GAF, ATPase, and Fis domain